MKNHMMWGYLIHLSDNMWGDPGSHERCSVYHETFDTDEEVWRDTIDFLPSQGINTVLIDVGDAIQYESHPEIAIPGAWSKQKLKDELDKIRALGMLPLPKLNFSACHDAWMGEYSKMLSTSIYYKVCQDLIEEVTELFDHPKYFHLGLDEEDQRCQAAYSHCVIRQHEAWWNDAYKLFDFCEKAGTRPWVWSDYCQFHVEEYLEKMPKSVLQSNWYYGYYGPIEKKPDGTYKDPRYDTYRILEEAGYDQVPTMSSCCGCNHNAEETMELGKETIAPERLVGYLTTPWHFTKARSRFFLKHDAVCFYEGRKLHYPELCK